MCGIFGVFLSADSGFSRGETRQVMDALFRLSESRGKEASGAALQTRGALYVAKYPEPASKLITRAEYHHLYDLAFPESGGAREPVCLIGHSRLVTNGGQQRHSNNQPVAAGGMVAIHNGIVTNVDELWARHPELERESQLDTEALLKLARREIQRSGSLRSGVRAAYAEIEGVANLAVFFEDLDNALLATNNGSLYLGVSPHKDAYIFASERYILNRLLRRKAFVEQHGEFIIRHIQPGQGCLFSLPELLLTDFTLQPQAEEPALPVRLLDQPRAVVDVSPNGQIMAAPTHIPGEGPYILPAGFKDEFPRNAQAVAKLRRCTRCVLPETMPFIEFDAQGVCNYCRHDVPYQHLGLDALQAALEPYRKTNGEPDCLATFSGGRDSSFGLHFLKTVLKMNPVAYTYDWGMVTDLARRNQMRLCGKLGIEHILVSADIIAKRKNIRKNVTAWLRHPDLGTVPLFMAGDKQYFYYANKVGQQTGCKIIILCENLLETTRFKLGFCGIPPQFGSTQTYNLPVKSRVNLARYYGRQYLTNPAYLNASILDTLGAYLSYYFIPHNYLNIFRYIPWDEKEIASTLIREYNWETATDTGSTWRIGDGTASFYNYIYYTLAGLTENDTFRSNQIRAGLLTRAEALKIVETENQPRYESIQWYCDIIGVDFEETIGIINRARKLYRVE